jgi:hypothetical protein
MTDDVQQTRYADVLARLLAEIAAAAPYTADGNQILDGLAPLRSRTTTDFALALADAWAVLAEILGFHSARHHEEACLDLAGELRSLIELSRLVGYRPDPGLAASASLAFTIDDSGAAPVVTIPVGTAVTSVPNPGEQPVTFETVAPITARPPWNQLLPQLSELQTFASPPKPPQEYVRLAGTATNVAVGDGMLVPIGTSSRAFGIVTAVTVRPADPAVPGMPARPGWTRVDLEMLPAETGSGTTIGGLWKADPTWGPLLSAVSPQQATTLDAEELNAAAVNGQFVTADVFTALRAARTPPQSVLAFRAQAGILGGSAPAFGTLPQTMQDYFNKNPNYQDGSGKLIWTDHSLHDYLTVVSGKEAVYCDVVVRAAGPGPVVLRDGPTWRAVEAGGVDVRYVSAFTVSGKSTVMIITDSALTDFSIRGTNVYLAGELLPLASEPTTAALAPGKPIPLDDWVDGLAQGQLVSITGASATQPGLTVAHVTTLKTVTHELSPTGRTTIDLDAKLPDALLRASVLINANVAPATHGQSRSEVLGSAQGQDPMPSFTLSSGPLTYVPDPSGSGSLPALTVYVNGVRRDRVPALLDPGERGYTVSQDDNQISTIQFGSPLPTGVINVRADYRIGLGSGASVGSGQLSMLASRPPGVRAVTNPLPARGGADPETVAEAARNAPVSVRALGRVVSLVDYADFARAFPGVAKASARFVGAGPTRGVQVTVIGPQGTEITTDSDVYTGLVAGLAANGDELVRFWVLPAQRVPVRVGADLRVDPDRIAADVIAAANQSVAAALSFDARDLGQPVWASGIVEVLQSVTGVIAADLTALCRLVNGQPEDGTTYQSYLRPDPPAGSASSAAVLLTLDVTSLNLTVVAR